MSGCPRPGRRGTIRVMIAPDTTRHDVERWFLREGAPWLVRGAKPGTALARMLPFTVLIGVAGPLFTVLGAVLLADDAGTVDLRPDDSLRLLLVLLLGVVAAIAALVVFLRLRRRHEVLCSGTAGAVGLVGALLLGAVVDLIVLGPADTAADLPLTLLALLAGWLVVASGLGALVSWSLRRLVSQAVPLLSLVSRAIPPLLLLVAFLFINAEAWQLSANLDRSRLWGVVGFLVVMILLFLVFRLPREIAELRVTADEPSIAAACRDTPLASWATRLPGGGAPEPTPMHGRERLNVVGLLFVAQLIQVAVLAVAVFVLFGLFGALAVTDVTVEQWIARPPTPGTLFGLPVPISAELVQVCILISGISALYFAVYTVTDSMYRAEFLDNLLGEVRDLLLARECYVRSLTG